MTESTRRYAVRIHRGRGGSPTVAERVDWPDSAKLDDYQREVRGYVEQAMKVYLGPRHGLVVLCDEEGLLKPNPVVTAYRPWDLHPLVGRLLVVGYIEGPEGGDWRPLTAEEAAKVSLVDMATDAPAISLDGVLRADHRFLRREGR